MPTLQVRDLPNDIYHQLNYLAEKDHRSLAQEAIVLLKEVIEAKLGNIQRRKNLLKKIEELQINGKDLPDPVQLIREDRER